MMSSAAALKPADYIKKTIGSIMYTYYSFTKEFRVRPIDMEDLVDGLLFMMSYNYVQEQHQKEIEAKRAQESSTKKG